MNRNLLWKFLLVLFVVSWSAWELYPPTSRNLIDEFDDSASNTDTNFLAILERARKLDAEHPERNFRNLRDAIGTNDITKYFPALPIDQGVEDPTRAILQRLQRNAAGKIKLGLDLRGGTSFLVEVDTARNATNIASDLELTAKKSQVLYQAVEVLRKRVDAFGVAEPLIQPVGDDRILIQLPGLSEADKESARSQIQKAAFLEFRLVHKDSERLIAQGLSAPGYEILRMKVRSKDLNNPQPTGYYSVLVKKGAEQGLTGNYVDRAGVFENTMGAPEISLRFNTAGAELFSKITRANVGRQLAIVLDGELYSAPNIDEPIAGGSATIRGSFDLKEAQELANVLENPLEAPVTIAEERTVDPTLGKDSVKSGVVASIAGAAGTFIFMLAFYFFGGLVANLALALNVFILMGVMSAMNATLTLPGIAGIALTIGMAVDANVLIFERIREELAAGKSLRGAVTGGYAKAFGTIFDSNVTTLISSIILIFLGTGPVKGFGMTLSIGVCASMFSALLVTRLVFDFMVQKGWLTSIRMMPMIKNTTFDFLKFGKAGFATGWVIAVIGLGFAFMQGGKSLSVDFAGGDTVIYRFAQKVDVDQLRSAFDAGGLKDAQIQYQKPVALPQETLHVLVPFGQGDKVSSILAEKFPNAGFTGAGSEKVGPSVGAEIQRSAVIASLLALLGILFYVAFRYEFSFAVGAVVAVLHDVALGLGLFFLFGGQLSSTVIAAVLTIIGYSINDKIVNLDRIREDLKLGVRGSFKDIVNLALNQTLSRTIITGGSVLLVALSLYIFGGGVIEDFAFVFLVGVLAGTYSSIFVACPIVVWWHKGERPQVGAPAMVDNPVAARV